MSTALPFPASAPTSPARLFSSRTTLHASDSPTHRRQSIDDSSSSHSHTRRSVIAVASPRHSDRRLAALQHARHNTTTNQADSKGHVSSNLDDAARLLSSSDAPSSDPFHKDSEPTMSSDKSEEECSVLLGEVQIEKGAPPTRIIRTMSGSSKEFHAVAARLHSVAAPAANAAPIDPKGTSTVSLAVPVQEEGMLSPPAQLLDAPLDTMRPTEADIAATAHHHRSSSFTSSSQPHALDCWDTIRSQLKDKQLVIFLDYDGTLTPIVSEPSMALIDSEQRQRLAEVAQKFPVSIVTGRKMATIKQFVLGTAGGKEGEEDPSKVLPGLERLYFAGSHGFDISCPAHAAAGGNKQVAEDYLPMLHSFFKQCDKECKDIPGALVEDSTFSISVHYRNVASPADVERMEAIVTNALKPFENKLQRHRGKMVHEIRPKIDWHKGAAVDYLLKLIFPALNQQTAHAAASSSSSPSTTSSSASSSSSPASAPRSLRLPDGRSILPVYIGDDTTDEDAFRLLRGYNNGETKALTIFVRTDDKARESAANYVLRDPHEVGEMLHRLANL